MSAYDRTDPRSSKAHVPDFAATLDNAAQGLEGVRVGVPRTHFFDHVEPDIERGLEGALDLMAELGATLHEVDIPHARHASHVFFVLVVAEAAALQHEHLRDGRAHLLGEDVRGWAQFGNLILAKDYIRAQQMRTLIAADWAHAFDEVDVVVTPATAAVAKRPDQHPVQIDVMYPDGFREDVLFAYGRFLMPVSVAGLPGLVVPCGLSAEGLPIGLQIVARAFDESAALRVGAALEREMGTSNRRPSAVTGLATV
jgi:aspartyl-tRNA(Asn)/glutamyl-tRNA(Gln) amidotransferase subunit A